MPLEKNRRTKLWEFWHVQSGEIPKPDPEWQAEQPAPGKAIPHPNRWVIMEKTGMVFVLIPGGTFVQGTQKDDWTRFNLIFTRLDLELPTEGQWEYV